MVCPRQVRPEIPRKALNDGISGIVVAQIHIKGGRVSDVNFVSGPKVYYSSVRNAVMRYECNTSAEVEVVARQEFNFRIE